MAAWLSRVVVFMCLFRYNVDVDILKEIEHEGDTVDGRNPAPVEVGSLSQCLQNFIHPGWLAGPPPSNVWRAYSFGGLCWKIHFPPHLALVIFSLGGQNMTEIPEIFIKTPPGCWISWTLRQQGKMNYSNWKVDGTVPTNWFIRTLYQPTFWYLCHRPFDLKVQRKVKLSSKHHCQTVKLFGWSDLRTLQVLINPWDPSIRRSGQIQMVVRPANHPPKPKSKPIEPKNWWFGSMFFLFQGGFFSGSMLVLGGIVR